MLALVLKKPALESAYDNRLLRISGRLCHRDVRFAGTPNLRRTK